MWVGGVKSGPKKSNKKKPVKGDDFTYVYRQLPKGYPVSQGFSRKKLGKSSPFLKVANFRYFRNCKIILPVKAPDADHFQA